ncbi:hypothetical protein [Vagococcus bubulae]|uniref:WxL domain-containing protein n=1 Tax=Vagococcus bubulae TaxID=1977868 RepID=A0A429ZEQ7_9ENTE|nr:hypothetical protein [Vagococcus bubulae]RST92196.1 hypothetical protein CBF36_08905 [Vagococcus bubulae]
MKRILSVIILLSVYWLVIGESNLTFAKSSTQIQMDSSSDMLMNEEIADTTDTTQEISNVPHSESFVENTADTSQDGTISGTSESMLPSTRTEKSLVGNGTQSSPFLIYTYNQLSNVATTINASSYPTINSGTVYIKLMADITSNGTRVTFSNSKNPIIIDGSTTQNSSGNHYIYYTGNSGYAGLFALGTGNMTITFKNINFGSKDSPRSNYYGFCYSTSNNNIINIQDVHYYAEIGGQPFYVIGSNSVLNFSGNNTFVVSNIDSNSNQEFAEFAGTMNFKEGSKTAIVQKTNAVLAFIWSYSTINMNVESNAQVFIQSGKTEMFYPRYDVNLTVSESAMFTYLFDPNLSYIDPQTVFGDSSDYETIQVSGKTNASTNNFFSGSANFNLSAANQSQIDFITTGYPFQTGTLDINTQDTASIKFLNQMNTSPALNSSNTSLKVTNNSKNSTIYNLAKTPTGSSTTPVSELIVPGTSSVTLTSNLPKYSAIVYEPAVKVGGIIASGLSGIDENKNPYSKITSHLTGVSSSLDSTYTYKAQYYVTNDTSTVLDNATLNNNYDETVATQTHLSGSFHTSLDSLPSVATEVGDQSTLASLDQLFSSDYTVYGRLAIISQSNHQTYYTSWENTMATIDSFQAVTLPTLINIDDNISYTTSVGKFGMSFNKQISYPIVNQSNRIIEVMPTVLTPMGNNNVTIVTDSPNDWQDKTLQLQLNSDEASIQWNFGNLINPTILELQPYWDIKNNVQHFYLDGAYSGPFMTSTPAIVDYTLAFSINPK